MGTRAFRRRYGRMDQPLSHRPASTADAFDTARWRVPEPRRDAWRPANDEVGDFTEQAEWSWRDTPRWVIVAGGGVAAAIMGAMLGGALHI